MRKRVLSIFLAIMLTTVVAGCGAVLPAAVDVVEKDVVSLEVLPELTPNLTVDLVAQAITDQDVVIVDVREDYEYADGHIPGAVLLPLGDIPDRVDEIPSDVPVILVCRSGNRSGQAYQYLKNQGFTNIHNMLGGMVEWTASGYDVEK